jgi:hypothetical protein
LTRYIHGLPTGERVAFHREKGTRMLRLRPRASPHGASLGGLGCHPASMPPIPADPAAARARTGSSGVCGTWANGDCATVSSGCW